MKLSVSIGGIELRNPIVIASSPLTATVYRLKQAEKFGAAAASTKLAFIKQPFQGRLQLYSEPGHCLIVPIDKRLNLDEAVKLVRDAKKETDLVILSNITHAAGHIEGWIDLATSLEEAGADMIELNFVCPNIEFTTQQLGIEIEETELHGASISMSPSVAGRITKAVKEAISIPVVCKLNPDVADVVATALSCEEAGADAIAIGGNYSSLPSVDVYNGGRPLYPSLDKVSFGALCGPCVKNLSYAVIAKLYKKLKIPIIGGGGVINWRDTVEMMMWGATAVAICTGIMWYGFEIVSRILKGLERFMRETGYESPEDFIGCSTKYIAPSEELAVYPEVKGIKLADYPTAEYLQSVKGKEVAFHPALAVVDEEKCNGCGVCVKPGHCEAITLINGKAHVNEELCLGCGVCESLCPQNAITVKRIDLKNL
ncbi:hypothetical protein DRO29_02450 [Candidatus Bathyarchaeota archaeon]|nr:MAG: hypothetical protein DRO29_02450 [Candidatus Bathyarchaeota archaeon]